VAARDAKLYPPNVVATNYAIAGRIAARLKLSRLHGVSGTMPSASVVRCAISVACVTGKDWIAPVLTMRTWRGYASRPAFARDNPAAPAVALVEHCPACDGHTIACPHRVCPSAFPPYCPPTRLAAGNSRWTFDEPHATASPPPAHPHVLGR